MKLTKLTISLLLLIFATTAFAQSTHDLMAPFGFATVSSRTDASKTFNVTGGGTYTYPVPASVTKVITLTSNGADMASTITNAIKNNNVIILDGSKGEFIVSKYMSLTSLSNKTILGINNATIRTKWQLTTDIKDALDKANVKNASTQSGTGGTLPNGSSVGEEQEYLTRLTLIKQTGDNNENYKNAGIIRMSSCSNIIMRNIKFVGPGSVDVGGSDNLTVSGCTNIWIDHCDFIDGMDGNFDINSKSDFITVSWCTFSYTDKSYSHQNTNLVGSSDTQTGDRTHLCITYAYNNWGKGCRARMPMGRFGKIHMLNNYYTCTGNATACINPRIESEFLIEGNYFDKTITNYFSQKDATAYQWTTTNVIASGGSKPSSKGTVTVPYTYNTTTATLLPQEMANNVGATLFGSTTNNPETTVPGDSSPGSTTDPSSDPNDPTPTVPGASAPGSTTHTEKYAVASGETTTDGRTITLNGITMTYGTGAQWYKAVDDISAPAGYTSYISGTVNPTDANGKSYSNSHKVPTKGTYYVFNPTTNGSLSVMAEVYTGKQLYVTQDGEAINYTANSKQYTSGDVINTTALYYGDITFPVEAGKTYHVFCISSKLMLFGFELTTTQPSTTNPDNPGTGTDNPGAGTTYPDPETTVPGDSSPGSTTDPSSDTNDPTATVPGASAPGSTPSYTPITLPSEGETLTFQENALYSKLAIDSRLNNFYANTRLVGFGTFDEKGNKTTPEPSTNKTTLDYVPGLVAKAVIEAVDYYKNNNTFDVKPWYYAVQNYANTLDIADAGKQGKSFDDLNAVKLYFTLSKLAEENTFPDGAIHTNKTTITTAKTRFQTTLAAMRTANEKYVIKSTDLPQAAGGWWHKAGYVNQMWCDGQYMGPALLAQIINEYPEYTPVTNNDWQTLTKQFTICWNMLWDQDKQLLYHAFTATPGDNYSNQWAGISPTEPKTYHSAEYWGRAEGWYVLALVDVLEQMDKANLHNTTNYTTLRNYLNKAMEGLAQHADPKTGLWYQLLQYDNTYHADNYNGTNKTAYNYLESSASAIFIATYLKAMRLGYLDTDYRPLARKAYKNFVENFIISDGKGGIHLINSCRSAGLQGSGNGYRDGSAAYYLLGSDVTKVTASMKQTEGKVLGAFILAATEYERTFLAQPPFDLNSDGKITMHDATIAVNTNNIPLAVQIKDKYLQK